MSLIIKITLNGTNENRYAKLWGLRCNPFPQIAKYEYAHIDRGINELSGEPIKDEADLRKRMAKWAPKEWIELCVQRFRPGERVNVVIKLEGID